jgi:antitoxin (DNA-binding transcriptional repressor) of toxin-antitoxin stability system
MIEGMELPVVHISEADLARDVRAILQRVQTGAEIIIERDAQPIAVLRAAAPARRTVSQCIALAKAHEEESGLAPTLDPDFAADVEEIIRNRTPWDPPSWD